MKGTISAALIAALVLVNIYSANCETLVCITNEYKV